jgi:cysteine desulfurase / selenocysteine lyase
LFAMLDIHQLRAEFPILHQQVQGKPLIYFDNAATSQKPAEVIAALNRYYTGNNANIHRGIHTLAERATADFEATREAVRAFINAESVEQVIFTRGTTEGINLVAATYGRTFIGQGDEIVISTMEHHSNIVPWQMLCAERGATLRVIPINDQGELLLDEYEKLLTERTKLVSIVHISNALGTINPVAEMVRLAHRVGAVVLVDGAQAAPHGHIDVQAIGADFYAFSGHKVYGPTGIGILYGKRALLEAMPPYLGGGEMIKEVTFAHTTYNDLPYKFEAGTPNIADTVALKSALDFVNRVGQDQIVAHEQALLAHATQALGEVPGLKIVGTAAHKASVVSFVVDGLHPMDIGMLLDANGIAVRTGTHCTMPLMQRFGISGTTRASFAVYNTKDEIDALAAQLHQIVKMMN